MFYATHTKQCSALPLLSDRYIRRLRSFGQFCATTVTCPCEPMSQSASVDCCTLSVCLRATRWHTWPARTAAVEFRMILGIYCPLLSWASRLQSLALRSLSLSLRATRRRYCRSVQIGSKSKVKLSRYRRAGDKGDKYSSYSFFTLAPLTSGQRHATTYFKAER
jgi:hypothetical protein